MGIKIIPFEQRYASVFKDLNLAWIKKYFYVEPHDTYILENCQATIIDVGGYIFFAEHDGHIVGCFSFLPTNKNQVELGKMAVDPKFQGLKIGQKLLSFAIDFAKGEGWEKIILYSSRKLNDALHIYRKMGFEEIALEKGTIYARSDIKMELNL